MKASRPVPRIPVPIRLIALMLVAILIPSVLITALGLLAVYRAEPMVRKQFAYPIEQALDRLHDRLSREWEHRLQQVSRRIALCNPGEAPSRDLLAGDPRFTEILLYRDGAVRRIRPAEGLQAFEASLQDPGLELARDFEFRQRDDRKALSSYRSVIADGTPDAVAEAFFGAARCHLRLSEWREAVRCLRRIVDRFGETADSTGVVRALPALLRILEISRENGDAAGEQLAAKDLAGALRAHRASLDPDQTAFYQTRLKRYPEVLQAFQAGSEGGAEGSAAVSPAPGAPAADPLEKELAERLRPHAEDREAAESIGYTRIALADRSEWVLAFFRRPLGAVVYLRLDPGAYIQEARFFTPELGLPESALRFVDAAGRPIEAGKPVRHAAGVNPLATRGLPRPLSHFSMEYYPAPGELTEELRRLETSQIALFTWSIVVLVLMIVLGVSLTLRAVFREMRVTKLKSDFVSFVTHELKTPLTSIRMFTETLLLDRVTGDADRRRCVEIIDQEASRLSRLIEQILEFSKIERHEKVFHFESNDMAEVVDDAVRIFLKHNRDSGCEIEVNKAQEHISRIKLDRAAMVELLLNLFSNALKYSRDSKKIVVNLRESINEITVEVIDQGIGIPKREQRKIFEKFYRAEDYLTREVEGTGLGLTFARYIAKAHSGDIKVQSSLNQGSTFTLVLRKERILAG